MSDLPRRARANLVRSVGRLLVITAICFTLTGCGFVKDLAMIPVKVAETVAVETVKVPFKAAELGVKLTVDTAFAGVDAVLADKK